MSLVKMIDGLIDEIGTGINAATIRSRLLTMREQAEALDAILKRRETALEECNSALHDLSADFERLKSDAQAKEIKPKTDLADDAIRVLKLLFQQDGLTLQQITSMLSLNQGMAKYHCGELENRGMIRLPNIVRMGFPIQYFITHEGRQYLVKNSLV